MRLTLAARVLGAVFIVAAIAGVVPAISSPAPFDAPFLQWDAGYRFVLGIVPVNYVHDGVHLFFGLWGVLAFTRNAARLFLRAVAIVYAVLVVVAMLPAMGTLFGAIPLYGWDAVLHGAIALYAVIFAVLIREPRDETALPERESFVGR